jgi:hypothetical protein
MRILILLTCFVLYAHGADITGKWTATAPAGKKAGGNQMVFNLKAEGDKLTGTVGLGRRPAEIVDGKISGDEITFAVLAKTRKQTARLEFRGKVSGDEIKITRTGKGAKRAQEFTAKRAS